MLRRTASFPVTIVLIAICIAAVAVALICVSACNTGQVEYGGSGPVPDWILGKWATGDWSKREPMEVLEFCSDYSYVRAERFNVEESKAIGHFEWFGDKIVLHPEFFAVDAEHGGGKADRVLTIRKLAPESSTAIKGTSIAFRLINVPAPIEMYSHTIEELMRDLYAAFPVIPVASKRRNA